MPYINVKVAGGEQAPTAEQKAQIIQEMTDVLVRVLDKNPATTTVVIEEVDPDNWGLGGKSVTEIRKG